MKRSTNTLGFSLALFSLSLLSCSTPPADDIPTPSGVAAWEATTNRVNLSLRETGSLRGVAIPILRAPALEKSWGSPRISTSPQGHYSLAYKDPSRPFERLVIYGSPIPFPRLHHPPKIVSDGMVNGELAAVEESQTWKSTTILGTTVRWFTESKGGGADGAYHATESFDLGHGGTVAHYRLVIETITNAEPERFQAVSW